MIRLLINLVTAGIIFMPSFSQADKKFIRKGNRQYQETKYQEAEILYRKALEKDNKSDRANYNLGNSLYKQDKYEAASAKFENLAVSGKEDNIEKSKYYYNLGNSYFKSNKLKESIEAYKNALRNNPADKDAKHNLQLAQNMLEMQQQQQQNKSEQNEQQDNQNQNQNQQQQQQQQQQQAATQQISREDAERLLDEIAREEKDVLKKVQLEKARAQKVPVDKNW